MLKMFVLYDIEQCGVAAPTSRNIKFFVFYNIFVSKSKIRNDVKDVKLKKLSPNLVP